MTNPSDAAALYQRCTLVRVVGPDFVAGLLIDPDTDRCVVTAPSLYYLRGQPAAKLRQTFARMGWRATIVKRPEGHSSASS